MTVLPKKSVIVELPGAVPAHREGNAGPMRKKIIIVVSLFSLCMLVGGIYLIHAVDTTTARFSGLIELHQVEILREHLLLNISRVQADLFSSRRGQSKSAAVIADHARAMQMTMSFCFSCHHEQKVQQRLLLMQDQVLEYGQALQQVLAENENGAKRREMEDRAYALGEDLIRQGDTMIALTNTKLAERTGTALQDAKNTRIMLICLISLGPVLGIGLAFILIRNFTKPINALMTAANQVKTGNLDSRIEGLTDEFAEVAIAFNDMAGSLREHMRAIKESEKRYRLLFESAGDAIFILEAEGPEAGKIVQANEAAAKLHGYTIEELMSMNIRDVDSPEAMLGVPVRMARLLAGERLKTEITHRKKDGTVFPVEISAAMFELNERKYILAIDRDTTERKQSEEALQRAQQIRLAGELATGLAHEIKNPLAGIKVTMAALSEEEYLTAEDRDLLKRVIDEIKRIEYLMKALLSFAKPRTPHFVETDVNSILQTVATLAIKNRAGLGNGTQLVKIVNDLTPGLPEILADPMHLQQIFMNLLLNAVDAMPEGGTLTMRTSFDIATSSVHVEISDTGKGVESTVLDKLFQPFFTTKPKGTGLGLAITKRLVEEHGGVISLRNNAEGGVKIILHLPVTQRQSPVSA
jgi:two-component system sensor histidine kinase AtoS